MNKSLNQVVGEKGMEMGRKLTFELSLINRHSSSWVQMLLRVHKDFSKPDQVWIVLREPISIFLTSICISSKVDMPKKMPVVDIQVLLSHILFLNFLFSHYTMGLPLTHPESHCGMF